MNQVYPGGGILVAKILDVTLFGSLKNTLSKTFPSPKLSLGN